MILGQRLVLHYCIDWKSHRLHAVRTLAEMSGRGVLADPYINKDSRIMKNCFSNLCNDIGFNMYIANVDRICSTEML